MTAPAEGVDDGDAVVDAHHHFQDFTGGRYPWLNDKGVPLRQYNAAVPYLWKLRCPIGGETYPTNDFAAGDFTSGAYPDDGIGGGCDVNGKKYGFLAELNQTYCHEMLRVFPECAAAYVSTGDPRYLHKALVAVSRLAVEYAYLATMTQHRHRNSMSQVERFGQVVGQAVVTDRLGTEESRHQQVVPATSREIAERTHPHRGGEGEQALGLGPRQPAGLQPLAPAHPERGNGKVDGIAHHIADHDGVAAETAGRKPEGNPGVAQLAKRSTHTDARRAQIAQ